MDRTEISQKIYEKYILPTERKREEYIGIEIELPIVNLKKEPVSFDLVHRITEEFLQEFGFETSGVDDEGHIYAALQRETGDILSYDCAYNNLELSLGKAKDIHTLKNRFETYFSWLQKAFSREEHMLTGMGINPYRNYNHNVPIPNERYRMLFHHLASYTEYPQDLMEFHHYPTYGSFASASQVQLDFDKEQLIQAIRAFSRVEPVKAVLFSNSVMAEEEPEMLCCRDMLWENSTHGINEKNIGMFQPIPESLEELEDYLEATSLYCVMRDGKYVNFTPLSVMDYFASESVTGEFFDGNGYQKVEVVPEETDLEYLRSFKFEDLTFRGTIEFRSVCCQPVSEAMTVAAFHLGLKQKLPELDRLLAEDHVIYGHGYNGDELRKLFNRRTWPEFADMDALYELAENVVKLSEEGLKERNLGEEVYVKPLYERIRLRQNPAQNIWQTIDEGKDLETLIRSYGTL
ncbi:MAG: glutamylcysteine synthetase [Eubacteriales bacterium]|nr:glutamylcysteine synthetase [Eubacteriales bacterium]